MSPRDIDSSGKLTRFSLDRRITVLVLFLTTLVVGAVAGLGIPLEMIPGGFEDPFLMVYVPYRETPAPEMEQKLTIPMEEELSSLKGLKRISSWSSTSSSRVWLQFKQGTDMDIAYREVRDRVERARAIFPDDVDKIKHDPVLLQRCVHESARLHPSSPVAMRRAECPAALPNGERVEADELVVIDLMGSNRDQSVFGTDAAQFNPYRELSGSTATYGLSFGLGMHACIGRNLAAGVIPRADTKPGDRQFGTITLIAQSLLNHGVRPDPIHLRAMDTKTERPNWGLYPVLMGDLAS